MINDILKYNMIYDNIIISTNKELDEHLKRHLNLYMKNKKDLMKIYNWLTNRGYDVVIKRVIK